MTATPAPSPRGSALRIVGAAAAAARIEAAHRFIADQGPAADCLVVGESRRAMDDFARDAAARSGASFGGPWKVSIA